MNNSGKRPDSELRDILEASPVGVAILEQATGKRLFVNTALVKCVGASSHEDLLGREILESWAKAADYDNALADVTRNEYTDTFEAERLRQDGTHWWALMSSQPIIFNGLDARIIWQLDITDRKLAERELETSESRFRDFAESSSDWLWEIDSNFCVNYVSDRFQQITGIDPSIYIGNSRRDFSKENIKDEKWRQHLSDLENHLPFRSFTNDVTTPDGSRLTVSSSPHPVFDDEGNFTGYRGSATNITEQKRTEEARDEALRLAEAANKAKSEFLATMSHEFRTPLNAIMGFSELMQAQYFGPLGSDNYLTYAADINRSGEHMLTLISDVLDMAAIEAGKRAYDIEFCSVPELIKECLRNVELMATECQIDLTSKVSDDMPDIQADVRSVRQILLNLLSNALKFTDEKGTVEISAILHNQELKIVVKDTGVGIPSDKLDAIAEPFSKLQEDLHLTQDGTGLGLSIVKSLVEAHKGELHIESELGKGTSVLVVLPVSH